jgi:hypothetical protein
LDLHPLAQPEGSRNNARNRDKRAPPRTHGTRQDGRKPFPKAPGTTGLGRTTPGLGLPAPNLPHGQCGLTPEAPPGAEGRRPIGSGASPSRLPARPPRGLSTGWTGPAARACATQPGVRDRTPPRWHVDAGTPLLPSRLRPNRTPQRAPFGAPRAGREEPDQHHRPVLRLWTTPAGLGQEGGDRPKKRHPPLRWRAPPKRTEHRRHAAEASGPTWQPQGPPGPDGHPQMPPGGRGVPRTSQDNADSRRGSRDTNHRVIVTTKTTGRCASSRSPGNSTPPGGSVGRVDGAPRLCQGVRQEGG